MRPSLLTKASPFWQAAVEEVEETASSQYTLRLSSPFALGPVLVECLASKLDPQGERLFEGQ